jgi:hypothetical protein
MIYKIRSDQKYYRANGAERRSGRKPGARVLIPPAIYTRGNESISEV